MEGAVDLKVFADTLQNVSRHHELIAGIDTDARSHLVFLLTGHDFAIDARNVDARVQASLVHGIRDGTSKVVFGADGAVVGTLGTVGHTLVGPSEGSAFVQVEEGEFLFQTKPDFFVFFAVKGFHGLGTIVGGQRFACTVDSRCESIARVDEKENNDKDHKTCREKTQKR